jgi:peptidoglycan hydrolase CwlO-like protein
MENKIQYERRFTIIEEKLDSHCQQQEKDFAEVKADTKDVKSDIKELSNKIEKFIESADGRYADKETEKIVKGVGWLILVAFVTALIYLVGWNR